MWNILGIIFLKFLAKWMMSEWVSEWGQWMLGTMLVHSFAGAFAKLRRTTISFVMSVCLSVRLFVCLSFRKKQLGSSKGGFSWNLVFEYLYKICRENSIFTKIREEWCILYIETNIYIFMTISRWILLRIIIFQTKFAKKIKTQILCSVTFSRKSCRLLTHSLPVI